MKLMRESYINNSWQNEGDNADCRASKYYDEEINFSDKSSKEK
jgi:hypothetical protein